MLSLVGKNAIVTGGSGGIGQAICKGLANAGASSVFAVDLYASKSLNLASNVIKLFDLDVSNEEQVRSFFQLAVNEGQPSIIVNAAGITRDGLLSRQTR